MKIVFALLLLALVPLAHATDLRGRVEVRHPYTKQLYPRGGIPIHLTLPGQPQAPVRKVFSGPDGMFYMPGVAPGNYLLVVNNRQVAISVRADRVQDLPPIQIASQG